MDNNNNFNNEMALQPSYLHLRRW